MDSLDTPVSTTEPTPDTTGQALIPPALVYSPILWVSCFLVSETGVFHRKSGVPYRLSASSFTGTPVCSVSNTLLSIADHSIE